MIKGGVDNKRGIGVWHRRAGKDSVCLNFAAVASQMRVGTIWHMLPTLTQARKVIWKGIDKQGRRMIDQAFPEWFVKKRNESDMSVEMHNGSIYQVVGSDNYDSLVGANPVGVIMSEYSIANPLAWDYIRPILAENGGWALFIYTPRGGNHGKRLFDAAQGNERWLCSLLTVEQTKREDGSPVISLEAIDEERKMGMSEEKIQQEFYCSWEGGMEGAYYTSEISDLLVSDRYGQYPHDPRKRVNTYWDIGINDQTSIIFTQEGSDGNPIIIDFEVGRNRSIESWIKELREKPYDYYDHWWPHDGNHREQFTGKRKSESAAELGFHVQRVEGISIEDGINASRAILRTAKFNKPKVQKLIDGLQAYRKVYDDKMQRFKDNPLHDWSSDIADSFRYLSVSWSPLVSIKRGNSIVHNTKVKGALS
jgi:phage terminase large subunit